MTASIPLSASSMSTSSVFACRSSTFAMPSAFTRASAMADADSSTATTRPARPAIRTAKVPTPAYASTTVSVPLKPSASMTIVATRSAWCVLTWKNDGDATRKVWPPSSSV